MNKKGLCRASLLCTGLRLSKNLYNEKGRPPYPYKSAKSRDLCVAFCTSQGRGAPLVRWPDGHTFFGPVSGRPYFLCFSAYNRPGAGAQYGSGGSPPARERSMGAEALRQPLAKTRKSGLSHFFDTLTPSCSRCRKRAFCKKIISQPLVPWITLSHFRLRSRKTHQTHLMI